MAGTQSDILIIGAGPAGLALGACLRRRGIPFTLVERGAGVGTSWRNRYDRLHLHTAKQHSSLPYLGFPRAHPRYPSRDQVVDYLQRYAREFGLKPRFGIDVTRLRRDTDRWVAETPEGPISAARVVLATGFNRVPVRPHFPGEKAFAGSILHAIEYRNAEPFRGQRVLVVGAGNTGAEIALELSERGCPVALCIRSPVHVIPRDFVGVSTQAAGIHLSWAPLAVRDRTALWMSKAAYRDLDSLGIRRPDIGLVSQIVHQRKVPLIDIGTIDAIRAGAIDVRPAIARLDRAGVQFVHGGRVDIDAVILATGYRSGLADWIEGGEQIVDDQGYPIPTSGETALPGLFTVGYTNDATGWLRGIGREAPEVAARLAAPPA